jgi:hypothetical protein
MPKLENWGIMIKDTSYVSNDFRYCLYGNVYNHHKYEDGTPIITKVIDFFDSTFMLAKTPNNVYELGVLNTMFVEYLSSSQKTLEDFDR